MSMREKLDISAYLVIGPENTLGRPVAPMIKDAIEAGFTCIQIRSKTASAKELIQLTKETADVIKEIGKADEVALLVNDRLDVILAAKEEGIKVDGIHVGQTDIPVDVCRKYLGEDAIVGISARTEDLLEYIQTVNVEPLDYFGIGPLRETATKPDCGQTADGQVITRDFSEVAELVSISPIPVVLGGGVKLDDLAPLAETDIDGFFVVSAVTEADDPKQAATDLVNMWKSSIS